MHSLLTTEVRFAEFDSEESEKLRTTNLRQKPLSKVSNFGSIARAAGMGLALIVTPATALADAWIPDTRRRDITVGVYALPSIIGEIITRAEAQKIIFGTLQRAERLRKEAADQEAAYWGLWEGTP